MVADLLSNKGEACFCSLFFLLLSKLPNLPSPSLLLLLHNRSWQNYSPLILFPLIGSIAPDQLASLRGLPISSKPGIHNIMFVLLMWLQLVRVFIPEHVLDILIMSQAGLSVNGVCRVVLRCNGWLEAVLGRLQVQVFGIAVGNMLRAYFRHVRQGVARCLVVVWAVVVQVRIGVGRKEGRWHVWCRQNCSTLLSIYTKSNYLNIFISTFIICTIIAYLSIYAL